MLADSREMRFEEPDLGEVNEEGGDAHHERSCPAAVAGEEVDEAGEFEDEPAVACPCGETVVFGCGGWDLVLVLMLDSLILVRVLVLILLVGLVLLRLCGSARLGILCGSTGCEMVVR